MFTLHSTLSALHCMHAILITWMFKQRIMPQPSRLQIYECVASFTDNASGPCAERLHSEWGENIPSPCDAAFRNCTRFRLDGWRIYYGWTTRSAWRWHVNTRYVLHPLLCSYTQKTWPLVKSSIIHNRNTLKPFNSCEFHCHALLRLWRLCSKSSTWRVFVRFVVKKLVFM
jgi:hypothetical protein